MDRKIFNLVVFIDTKKAFDTVDHQILLQKLELYGIKGNGLSLLRSYLTDRSQKCQVKDSFDQSAKLSVVYTAGLYFRTIILSALYK